MSSAYASRVSRTDIDYAALRSDVGAKRRGHFNIGDLGEDPPPPGEIGVVTLAEFVAVDEAGAAALLGSEDNALIPEGGDVMVYGDGGAGKTTLAIDLACHLAAGESWLGIEVPRPVGVLLIENEGPRPLLRRKLKRKLGAWTGGEIGERVRVFESPWARFTFAIEEWREELGLKAAAWDIDVIIVGPLVRVGMDEAGTLQDVVAFMRLVADLRERSMRPLTVVIIHHENKSGAVSGAWEGAGDTLLHVQGSGNGHTILYVQKARWAPEHHHRTYHLAWTEGEGFEVESDRDLAAEIVVFLTAYPWRTAKEIAAPREAETPGVGANEATVRKLLDADAERFESRTGDDARALGRHPSAILWRCVEGSDSPDSPCLFSESLGGGRQGGESVSPPVGDSPPHDAPPAVAPADVQLCVEGVDSPRRTTAAEFARGGIGAIGEERPE